jgi:catechol 2,3-dioxygenase-like lactoylglutathione lyase family enzyme
MKRFHVHLSVPDLPQSIAFYTRLFGAEPSVRKDDYAKWMIDEPRVNFAISHRGAKVGLNHLGLQADDDGELAGIREQFERADAERTVAETGVACCYARSNKHWVTDPQGIAWEAFHSFDTVPVYDGSAEGATACCTEESQNPASKAAAGCCAPGANARGKATAGACC